MAQAADSTAQPTSEVWAGADISENVWLVYSGVTLAPWSGLYENGWRFRAAGGYGGYGYRKDPDKIPDEDAPVRPVNFDAQTYFADFLVGYLMRFGELTAKAFVGASLVGHDIRPNDDETIAIGDEVGVKGAIELWLNMGEKGWGSLDLSWSSAHETRAVRSRVGYRFWPQVSLGVEGGLNVDAQGACRMRKAGAEGCTDTDETGYEQSDLLDYARAGAFARYEWGTGEASVSAGVLGESLGDEVELAPYVTVNWLTQF